MGSGSGDLLTWPLGGLRGCLVLVPISFIPDPPRARAEPISEAGDAPMKTRKGRKHPMDGGRNKVRNKGGTERSEEEMDMLRGEGGE